MTVNAYQPLVYLTTNYSKNTLKSTRYLGDMLTNGGVIEIGGIARVPLAVAFVEIKLHQMASDGGHQHVTWLPSNWVIELVYLVVARPPFTNAEALVLWENAGHRLRHRRLLGHVQHVYWTATAGHLGWRGEGFLFVWFFFCMWFEKCQNEGAWVHGIVKEGFSRRFQGEACE